MRAVPDSFLAALGPLRPLLADDAVLGLTLQGTDGAWVDRVDTPPRGMEPLAAAALTRLVEAAMGNSSAPATPVLFRLPPHGHVCVVPAPYVGGGVIVTMHTGRCPALALADLAPPDVTDTLRRCLSGGLGMLVVGASPAARLGALGGLWEAMPAAHRRAVVEPAPSGVAHLGALHVLLDAQAGMPAGLPWLQLGAACFPELHLGGLAGLQAAGAAGQVLASCVGFDAGAARGALLALGAGAADVAAGLFALVVELGHDPSTGALRVMTVVDGRNALAAMPSPPWWRATPGGAGVWGSPPFSTWRIPASVSAAVDPQAREGTADGRFAVDSTGEEATRSLNPDGPGAPTTDLDTVGLVKPRPAGSDEWDSAPPTLPVDRAALGNRVARASDARRTGARGTQPPPTDGFEDAPGTSTDGLSGVFAPAKKRHGPG